MVGPTRGLIVGTVQAVIGVATRQARESQRGPRDAVARGGPGRGGIPDRTGPDRTGPGDEWWVVADPIDRASR